MNLAELTQGLAVRGGASAVRICDITDDSRTVLPGSLFVARAGATSDGRAFIPDALKAGAAAILTDDPGIALPKACSASLLISDDLPKVAAQMAERFYGSPTSKLDLVGITGTNGKTTTAHLVHQFLNSAGVRCGLIGTVVIDDGREVADATMTTPPATELSRTFATMLENGCRAAAMEVSSHALDQQRVGALRFDVGVFTNLTGDHLDYHGTMEAYSAAKQKLFAMLPPTGWAILNVEDPHRREMAAATRAEIMWCSLGDMPADGGRHEAEARCTIRDMSMSGTLAEFAGPWGTFEVRTGLVGRHNAMNLLQAIGASWAAGVSPAALAKLVEGAAAPPGRLERITRPTHPFAVLVDYAHTDDALQKVLTTLRPLVGPRGTLRVVFGCGGDRDRTKRPRMAAVAAASADAIYITSDNPRTERPSDIIDEILRGIPPDRRSAVRVDADRARAIEHALGECHAGDILLIAGKGHETYQIMPDGRGGTVTHHFDDREVARGILGIRNPAGVR